MRKQTLVAAFALAALAMTSVVSADRYARATNDNPLKIARYIVHPVGIALEYVIMRPIHWVVSQPDLDIVFGHAARQTDQGTYFEWTHGDYRPTIVSERKSTAKPVTNK